MLISGGANVSAVGADGAHPIHIAAKYFKVEKHLKESVSVVEDTTRSPFGSAVIRQVCHTFIIGPRFKITSFNEASK